VFNKKAVLSQGKRAMQRVFAYTEWLCNWFTLFIYIHCLNVDVNVKL